MICFSFKLENENESGNWRNAELKEELVRHEELMEIMEKRFDEQHAKVMVTKIFQSINS